MLVAGVDEVGRGPLAGPVISAAVILDPNKPIQGLADSKTLSPRQREVLYEIICLNAWSFAFGRAEVEEIDRLNILQASLLSMKRAIENLASRPDKVLVDGTFCPSVNIRVEAIVEGDKTVQAISAASILAKVYRDREMCELDKAYPGYGFATHKGYPTAQHRLKLAELGPCLIHRRSFSPVRRLLAHV